MTVSEFESYLQKGLGRAILLLQQETDKTPFFAPLSKWILDAADKLQYHRQLGEYEVDLIRCFDDHEKRAAEIAEELLAHPEYGMSKYRHFLCLLGYEDALCNVLISNYQASYKVLYAYQKENPEPPYDITHAAIESYFGFAVALKDVSKKDPVILKKLVSDIADLYDLSTAPIVPNALSPVWPDTVGNDIMEDVYLNHRHGKKLERDYQAQILSFTKSDDSIKWSFEHYEKLSKASPDEIRKIAELALTTEDPKERFSALLLFEETSLLNLPIFPLDPSPLISMAKERIEYIRQGKELGQWSNELSIIMIVLSRITVSAIKDFAYELLEEKTLPPALRAHALSMLLTQGEPKERDTIISYLDEWDALLPSESMVFLCRLAETGHPNAPVERLQYYYENATMSYSRERVLKAMRTSHSLSDNIRQECCYDASPFIREFIQKEE